MSAHIDRPCVGRGAKAAESSLRSAFTASRGRPAASVVGREVKAVTVAKALTPVANSERLRVVQPSGLFKLNFSSNPAFTSWCRGAHRLVVPAVVVLAALQGCSSGNPKSPGVDLGAPDVRWAEKNYEQRMGFMAAQVNPIMHKVFADDDASYKESFSCETCHGSQPELVNYRMPNPELYALPKDDPIGESMEYDEDVSNFMMSEVTPALQKLFDTGHGSKTKANCFSCHPVEE